MVDDLGFDDLRSHDTSGSTSSFTPIVAGLVRDGVLLDRHHAFKWCSPTRRSFLTGRYPVSVSGAQAGTGTNLTPLQFTVLSEKMHTAGYEAHFVGKGHLGWQTSDHLLVNRGFTSHVGFLGGGEGYKYGGGSQDPTAGTHDLWFNHAPALSLVPEVAYSTNFYSEYAVSKIQGRNTSLPFWLHVAYQAVHEGAFREDVLVQDQLPKSTGFRDQGYGNALVALDHGIGNITRALKAAGMWDSTLLVVFSDNGGDDPAKPSSHASNYPLLGRKCLSFEGGTRVFAFVNGGLLPPRLRGTTNTQLMHVADWYPTLCALAGVDSSDNWFDPTTNTTHPIDGVNLWPALISGGITALPRKWLPTTAMSILLDARSLAAPASRRPPGTAERSHNTSHGAASAGGGADVDIVTGGAGVSDVNGGHMWKLIVNETQGWRFHPNGTEYPDPYNPCLSPDLGRAYNCIDAYGSFGRLACYACSPQHPCLYDVLQDPSETNNVAVSNPEVVAQMANMLAQFQRPYAPPLPATALACFNCSFQPEVLWRGFIGPPCIRKHNTAVLRT